MQTVFQIARARESILSYFAVSRAPRLPCRVTARHVHRMRCKRNKMKYRCTPHRQGSSGHLDDGETRSAERRKFAPFAAQEYRENTRKLRGAEFHKARREARDNFSACRVAKLGRSRSDRMEDRGGKDPHLREGRACICFNFPRDESPKRHGLPRRAARTRRTTRKTSLLGDLGSRLPTVPSSPGGHARSHVWLGVRVKRHRESVDRASLEPRNRSGAACRNRN